MRPRRHGDEATQAPSLGHAISPVLHTESVSESVGEVVGEAPYEMIVAELQAIVQ